MQEQLISFKVAKLAKDKGFIFGKSIFHYDCISFPDSNELYIPELEWRIKEIDWKSELKVCTQSLLQRWLREVHNIHIMIEPYYNKNKNLVYGFDLLLKETEEEDICEDGFKTYEEALEEGLYQALKLIK